MGITQRSEAENTSYQQFHYTKEVEESQIYRFILRVLRCKTKTGNFKTCISFTFEKVTQGR